MSAHRLSIDLGPAGLGVWGVAKRGFATARAPVSVRWLLTAALIWAGTAVGLGADDPPSPWADFVEPDFPFFSSVLDARHWGEPLPSDNLTPRGVMLPLGHDLWAAFDLDLLRVAALWSGAGVTPVSMSQGSYHVAGRKAPEGERTFLSPTACHGSPTVSTPGGKSTNSPPSPTRAIPASTRRRLGEAPCKPMAIGSSPYK